MRMSTTEETPLDVVKRVLVAHEEAPLDDMARLIELADEDPQFYHELLKGSAEVLSADPASLVPCWLAIVVGELREPDAGLLLGALGTSEADALDETIVPVLARRIGVFFDAITTAIDSSDPEDDAYRATLYRVLTAVAVGEDATLRQRLSALALQRVAAERALPEPIRLLGAPLLLLAALRHPDTRAILDEIERSPDRGAVSDRDWADIASVLEGDRRILDASAAPRESWRDIARDIEKRFRPTA